MSSKRYRKHLRRLRETYIVFWNVSDEHKLWERQNFDITFDELIQKGVDRKLAKKMAEKEVSGDAWKQTLYFFQNYNSREWEVYPEKGKMRFRNRVEVDKELPF